MKVMSWEVTAEWIGSENSCLEARFVSGNVSIG